MIRSFLYLLVFLSLTFLPKTVFGANSKSVSFTQVITPLSTREFNELKKVFDSATKSMKQALNFTEHSVKFDKYHRLLLAYRLSPLDKTYLRYIHTTDILSSLSLPTLKNTHPPG